MIVTRTQSAGIRAIVDYLGGNPERVEEAVEELGSPEIISSTPGPARHHLSPQEQRALTIIQTNIIGPDCSIPQSQACKILEEIVCRDMEPEELAKYLQNLDQSFARNSVPLSRALLSGITNNLAPILVTTFGLLITSLFALTQSNKGPGFDQTPSINKPYPGTELKPPANTYPFVNNNPAYPELRNYQPSIYSQERFEDKKKEK